MIEMADLDKQIESLGEWILKAGKSLIPFYNPEKGYFWRDTVSMDEDKIHPTSTTRSFFALYEYLRFLYEENLTDPQLWASPASVLKDVVQKYFAHLPDDPDIAKSPDNGKNMFTNSHLIIGISILQNLQKVVPLDTDLVRIKGAANGIVDNIQRDLYKWRGGKIFEIDDVHHFITLHAVRAIDAHSLSIPKGSDALFTLLANSVKEDALRLNAYYFTELSSRFDATELSFTIALLNRFPTPDSPQITHRSIKCITEMQSQDGSCPLADM